MNIEIREINGSLIYSGEHKSKKEAAEFCAKNKISLRRADLSEADLSYANLSEANLSYANLSYANLSKANLSKANLSYANFNNSVGLPESVQTEYWHVLLVDDMLHIGCKAYRVHEWYSFTPEQIDAMDEKASEFWYEKNYRTKLFHLLDLHDFGITL